jgi:hypothetical protein
MRKISWFCILVCLNASVFAGSLSEGSSSVFIDPDNQLDQQALLLELSRLNATIRSEEDLALYLEIDKVLPTPLDYFSQSQKKLFIDSLVFTDHGLASFHLDVVRELGAARGAEVLELFGFDQQTWGINLKGKGGHQLLSGCQISSGAIICEGYACNGPGECISATGHACAPQHCK